MAPYFRRLDFSHGSEETDTLFILIPFHLTHTHRHKLARMKVEGQSSNTFMDYVTFVCVGGRGADPGTARVAIGGEDEVEGNQRVLVSPGEHHQSQGPPAV